MLDNTVMGLPIEFVNKKIGISVLNWGLGHATRISGLIDTLLPHNRIEIYSNGIAFDYLFAKYPHLVFKLDQKPYSYNQKGKIDFFNLLTLPFRVIKNKFKASQQIIQIQKIKQFDLLISDNCYGWYHSDIPSYMITHQLRFKKNGFETLSLLAFYLLLSKYTQIWIPDEADIRLSGEISTNPFLKQCQYIGFLTQFRHLEPLKQINQDKITSVLSGLETQRQTLEHIVLESMCSFKEKCLLVRGKSEELLSNTAHIQIFSICYGENLARIYLQSKIIIMRSGYSSIVDVFWLQQLQGIQIKIILIPTPNQWEQMYLARNLSDRFENVYCVNHNKNTVKELIQLVQQLSS